MCKKNLDLLTPIFCFSFDLIIFFLGNSLFFLRITPAFRDALKLNRFSLISYLRIKNSFDKIVIHV